MSDLTLACNGCGEAVAVAEHAQFVDCASCRARLAIVRTEQATCAVRAADEQVAGVRREVQELAGRVEVLQLELDWSEERARIGPVPNRMDMWVSGGVVGFSCLFSLGFVVVAILWNPPGGQFWTVGLAVALGIPILGGLVLFSEFRKIRLYESAYARYRARRDQLARVAPETRVPPANPPSAPPDEAIRAAGQP